ncbi:rod shape-determining protein MreD [Fusibacter tunisiensis]|uniref:Rod shape-determining protein MreD n=1 Tax=Fusibacter tunisiensis TaxID=1008308 RepID=A0ABS2MMY2_9FIRM|nr:rod shape-determining protein MreD [Fusibacter tunisiensis]MBM7560759.1 rod shape-determining protein MreD [Fusibacter tunisiensis]
MKYRSVVLLGILNFILSSSLLQIVRINDAMANLCIIFSIVIMALVSEKHAYVYVLVYGFLQDVFLGRMIGANVFTYLIIVFVAARLIHVLFVGNYVTPIFLVILSTVMYHFVFYLITFFFQATVPLEMLYVKIITEVVLNSLIALFVYAFAFKKINGYKLGDYNA